MSPLSPTNLRSIAFTLVVTVAGVLGSATSANATVLSNYSFNGNPASTSVDAAVVDATFSAFTRTNLTDDSQANVFRTTGFSTSSTIDTNQYQGFSVTASGASSLTFEGLSLDSNRSGQGPEQGAIRYLIDNVLQASHLYAIPNANTSGIIWNFADFILNPGQTVEFRFFGFDATSSSAFMSLDNVSLISAQDPIVPSVPEPTSIVLASMGAFLGFGGRYIARRRRPSASEA